MGGGGKNEVKETSAEKASASVAKQQWDIYKKELKPFEENFIKRVQSIDSRQARTAGKEAVAVGGNRAFSQARSNLSGQLASSGFDPSGKKFQKAMTDIGSDQAISLGDTSNRMETSLQDRKMAGLSDVIAMGDGEKGEAMAGMNAVASSSLRKASSDAFNSFNRQSANQQLAGAVVGAGANYMMNSPSSLTSNAGTVTDQSMGTSLRDNRLVTPEMNTHFGGR